MDLSMDIHIHGKPGYSQSKSGVAKNRRKFCMFLAPNFLGGSTPDFLNMHYKIDTGSDHVAKFRGDRPRELGDYALKKKIKKNITGKTEDLSLLRTGGLNMSAFIGPAHKAGTLLVATSLLVLTFNATVAAACCS